MEKPELLVSRIYWGVAKRFSARRHLVVLCADRALEIILENAIVVTMKGLSAETKRQGGKAKKRHSRGELKVITWEAALCPGSRVYETEVRNTESKYKKE
jgi:hypothetical protein